MRNRIGIVAPPQPPNDAGDVGLRYGKVPGDAGLRFTCTEAVADIRHLGRRQLRLTIGDPAKHPLRALSSVVAVAECLPSLGVTVGVVFGLRSKEKVVGAHAGWHIAAVEYALAFGNNPEMDLPTDAVGDQSTAAEFQPSIPEGASCTVPQPATISLFDLQPEAFEEWRMSHMNEYSARAPMETARAA